MAALIECREETRPMLKEATSRNTQIRELTRSRKAHLFSTLVGTIADSCKFIVYMYMHTKMTGILGLIDHTHASITHEEQLKEGKRKKRRKRTSGVEIREQRAGEGKEKEEHGSVRVEVVINYSLKSWKRKGTNDGERGGNGGKEIGKYGWVRIHHNLISLRHPCRQVITYLSRSFIYLTPHLLKLKACNIKRKGKTCFQYMECK